jgi:DNA-binding IclR family transcriptional regulator
MRTATSLERMLHVVDVIEENDRGISFDQMHSILGYTRSTLYRYLKILTDAEFITSLPDVGYMLGPRIIELDYKMRTRDPLLIASRPVMAELVRAATGIALLCRRYRDKVLCVHQERGTDAFHSNYERGRARPLLSGAASRIILCHMPPHATARLFRQQAQAFAAAGLGQSLADVRAGLKRIRQLGWDVTEGQVTPGVTGIAAPIFDNRGTVLGSLSLTVGRARMDTTEVRALADRVMFCAGIVTKAISGATIE